MISGRVQGVFFRGEAWRAALCTRVAGWIRNTRDGRVEAVFEGNAEDVDQMIRWCRTGSPAARVKSVEVENLEYRGDIDSFSVRY